MLYCTQNYPSHPIFFMRLQSLHSVPLGRLFPRRLPSLTCKQGCLAGPAAMWSEISGGPCSLEDIPTAYPQVDLLEVFFLSSLKSHISDLLHFLQSNGQDDLIAVHITILQISNPARAVILKIKEFIREANCGGLQSVFPRFIKSTITLLKTHAPLITLPTLSSFLLFLILSFLLFSFFSSIQ